jgi:hypothetical protein
VIANGRSLFRSSDSSHDWIITSCFDEFLTSTDASLLCAVYTTRVPFNEIPATDAPEWINSELAATSPAMSDRFMMELEK